MFRIIWDYEINVTKSGSGNSSPSKHDEVRLQVYSYLQRHLLRSVQHLPFSAQQQLLPQNVHMEMHIPQLENPHLLQADIVPEVMTSLGT